MFGHRALGAGDPGRRPVPRREATARATVLNYCDGIRTAVEISAAICREHPQLMPTTEELQRLIARVLADDTQ
jgi:hypothetical protein